MRTPCRRSSSIRSKAESAASFLWNDRRVADPQSRRARRVIALTVKFASRENFRSPGQTTPRPMRRSALRHAQQVGSDAVLLVSPYYSKPTQKGLFEHFKAIADSVDIPASSTTSRARGEH